MADGGKPIDQGLVRLATGTQSGAVIGVTQQLQQALVTAVSEMNKPVGPLARMIQGVKFAISGATPASWMSPLQPLVPLLQQLHDEARQFDYPVGYNVRTMPRSDEAVGFPTLRALADNCDLVRLAIETRKDELIKKRFNITHVDEKKDVGDDPTVKAIQEKLRYPDNRRTWSNWLRVLVEEVLVTDAASIYPRLTNAGDLWGLELFDGATLKVLIDGTGRRPLPPEPAYQQVLKGLPAVDYSSDELLYLPRNERVWKVHGFSPVEQVIMTVNIALRRQFSQLQYFTEGNIPGAFVSAPKEWTPRQVAEAQAYWDAIIEGQQQFKRKAKIVPFDKVQMTQESPVKDEFDEWLARVICYAFSLPPTAFVKQMNRATSEQSQDTATDQGLSSLMGWVKDVMDLIIAKYFKRPDLCFRWEDDTIVSPEVQAKVDDLGIRNGSVLIDEVRSRRGDDPYPNGMGSRPLIYTASGVVPLDTAIDNADNPPEVPQFDTDGNPVPPSKGKGAPPGAKKPAKEKDPKEAEKLAKAFKIRLRPNVRRRLVLKLRAKLRAALGDLKTYCVGALKVALELHGRTATKLLKADTQAEVERILANLDMGALMVVGDDLADAVREAAADGTISALSQIGFDEDEGITNLANERAEVWAAEHAAALIGMDADGEGLIADGTRAQLRSTVTRAIEEGWSGDQLEEELADNYGFSEARAETIARTELKAADSQGALAGYQSSGVVEGKAWQVSNEDAICDICLENEEAGVIPLDDEFPSGDDAPGAHPNCNCVLIPVVMDDEDQQES